MFSHLARFLRFLMSPTSILLALCSMLFVATPAFAQSQAQVKVNFKTALVDKDLNVKPVPKFSLVVQKIDATAATETAISNMPVTTGFDGTASLNLLPGDYVVKSQQALVFEDKTYEWVVDFKVEAGKELVVELSIDNAKVAKTTSLPKRRVSEEAEMFQELRTGVVTVEGELGHGTGFIVDGQGLIFTNQHVVSSSKEIRVEFDRGHKVEAKLLGEDRDKDLAVLWVNMDACPSCKVLSIATPSSEEPTVVEGEKVFTIGSPLSQSKILTAGIISKVEKGALISDININPGNSGGPLFNGAGQVVGITTFGEQDQSGPGVSGIIRIEEARELLAKAQLVAKSATARPSAELLPTEPEGAFPLDAIKDKIDVKKFETKPYRADVGKYQVTMITPVLKYYVMEKDRIEAARERSKRNKNSGAEVATEGGTIDKFWNLRNWAEYVGQLRPVVQVLAIPEVKATGKSMFLSLLALGAGAAGGVPMMTPLDLKFKADFYEMTLMCDGKPVTPIQRGKIEYVVPMQSYFKVKNRYTYAGVYTYPADAFDPARCKQLELQVFSEENPTIPDRKLLELKKVQKVWTDFDAYRQQQMPPTTPPVAPANP
jgi:S1-C subfamily serine protease